ncbi:LppP/LprE family lipoprotein [Gulosibacter macacae]|uniref:LppP/LprE family lipoprotein n=1 Tax=Gulosibacter macacae TaxID=2488791 RepID=A0A3P3W0P2_9MICO|nr:LppP/LprE family lipoprotein [Gulosibacter macacae]RRJ87908.1 LppP/LprE family lipoprotein [Gulosibacter macacae]
MNSRARLGIAALATSAALVLSGCAGNDLASSISSAFGADATATATTEPTSPSTQSSSPSAPPTATPAPSAPATSAPRPTGGPGAGPTNTAACGTMSGEDALYTNLHKLPPAVEGRSDIHWDPTWADINYDACADLSWITVPIEGGTASSPHQIMLFHKGEYLGTGSYVSFGFWPEVTRVNDATLKTVYKWPRAGESNAGASGRSTSYYTWDASLEKVVHSGEFPPH